MGDKELTNKTACSNILFVDFAHMQNIGNLKDRLIVYGNYLKKEEKKSVDLQRI